MDDLSLLNGTFGEPLEELPFCGLINCFATRRRCTHTEEAAKDLLMTVECLRLPTPQEMEKKCEYNVYPDEFFFIFSARK